MRHFFYYCIYLLTTVTLFIALAASLAASASLASTEKVTVDTVKVITSTLKPLDLSSEVEDLYYDICEQKDSIIAEREFISIKCMMNKAPDVTQCISMTSGVNELKSVSDFKKWFCAYNASIDINYQKLQTMNSECRNQVSKENEVFVSECESEEDSRLTHIDICINKNEETAKSRFAIIKCTVDIAGDNGTECIKQTLKVDSIPSNHTVFADWYCSTFNSTEQDYFDSKYTEQCDFSDEGYIDKIETCTEKVTQDLRESDELDDDEAIDEPIAVE